MAVASVKVQKKGFVLNTKKKKTIRVALGLIVIDLSVVASFTSSMTAPLPFDVMALLVAPLDIKYLYRFAVALSLNIFGCHFTFYNHLFEDLANFRPAPVHAYPPKKCTAIV